MAMEIGKLQEGGIIEHSMSPWRAQIVVVKNETNKQANKKKRKIMCGLFSNHEYLHRIRCLLITTDF